MVITENLFHFFKPTSLSCSGNREEVSSAVKRGECFAEERAEAHKEGTDVQFK